ncbi:hypothetical protein Y900_013580 [Mycolicibacterium aromaticivorans JS19b1 = JCM 16368]|uniref:DUF2694 domain-containing protein n=1 Tax=Mycolicibacterium aromaticivorans JS19b1 = JCM 16368 TaxID=1440774 RepID=A0A064CMJ9_9MYCO|nr:DUF2694 family protein [Mycolicibacterium aromaticivorans]KDE99938.1 hypothetical protein Y900_013580 [Mycolicibacterium aromaticivorans JS19b1 = JCM 16368]
MTEPDPEFDAAHPSGHILFRSCRGGYLHSVALAEPAMDADAQTLAQGILLTADVSYLKAVLQVRAEIVAAGHTPSDDVASSRDLELATEVLRQHRLRPDES